MSPEVIRMNIRAAITRKRRMILYIILSFAAMC